jgi:hypothetical protein
MRKHVILVCAVLTLLSQTACDSSNQKEIAIDQQLALVSEGLLNNKPALEKIEKKIFSDFFYDVGPRFASIKKTDLDTIRTLSDFIGEEDAERIVSYRSLMITILNGQEETNIKETGNSGVFTAAQIKLLQAADYSTNILIRGVFREKSLETGLLEVTERTPYLTIVPEKQAAYIHGMDALREYLKTESEEARIHVDSEKLQPAKLFFTVTTHGTIENVKLDRSSGYPIVDKTMIELIINTQKEWSPAENSTGKKVDQELVVSFGLMGC